MLYFGYQQRWNQPKSLLERLDIPERFRPYISDYRINVFEIAWLTREQVKFFKSDFRVVADYFVQMRENDSYTPDPQELRHVQETLQLLSTMTGDHTFEELYNEKNQEGRPHNMCEVLERAKKMGWQEGMAERENQIILNLYRNRIPLELIASSVEKNIDEVRNILEKQTPLLS